MSHKDAGHYRAKHPFGSAPEPQLAAELKKKQENNHMSCSDAEQIATILSITMNEVGTAMDLMELRITKCQLGLFGHGDSTPVPVVHNISEKLEQAIHNGLQNGRLPCKTAWDIAHHLKLPKLEVTAACDYLKIKIKPCQLGAF